MNQPDKSKRKFTYFENRDVFIALTEMAKEETDKRGEIVTVPTLIREVALKRANEFRRGKGQKPIDYDPSAGKFAPVGAASPAQAVVDLKGNLAVFDRKGNKISGYNKLTQVPQLLRAFPKCRVISETAKISKTT
jgi:hypothetical protein